MRTKPKRPTRVVAVRELPHRQVHWSPRDRLKAGQLGELKASKFEDTFGPVAGAFMVITADADWMVSGYCWERDGQFVIGHLGVEPNTNHTGGEIPKGGLGVRDLQVIGLSELVNKIRARETAGTWGLSDRLSNRPRRGRPPKPEPFYWQVAADYLDIQDGQPGRRDIHRALVERYEDRDREGYAVPAETMSRWIKKATELGFLSRGTPGRPGRSRGPRFDELARPVGRRLKTEGGKR